MKGIEESLSQTVFLIGSFLAAAVIVYMASQYLFSITGSNSNPEVSGKDMALVEIKNSVSQCLSDYDGKKSAEICSKVNITSSINISSSEIFEYLKGYRIDGQKIEAENLTGPCIAFIEYSNGKIFIENR